MTKISVIVPVYNSGEYFIPCLESLCAQTMDDIEIILVDDHGTDDSMQKASDFIKSYQGAKEFVLTQTHQNSGPGAARNVGISLAKGEYVAFVDSDDFVEPEFCELLYATAKAQDSELACCDIIIGNTVKRNVDVQDKKYFLRHFVSYFTTFLYKKSFLDEHLIQFGLTSSAEDTCFLTCCVLAANRMAQIHQPMYHYRIHDNSVSQKKNQARVAMRLKSIRNIKAFARKNGYNKDYRCELFLIFLKKGWGMAVKDVIFG